MINPLKDCLAQIFGEKEAAPEFPRDENLPRFVSKSWQLKIKWVEVAMHSRYRSRRADDPDFEYVIDFTLRFPPKIIPHLPRYQTPGYPFFLE